MKLLADENIEQAMIDWLRHNDHDVIWAAEDMVSSPDRQLLELASSSSRILLTRDLDFGELVYREKRISTGIILLRISANNQSDRLMIFSNMWSEIEKHAQNNFLVITKYRIRIRPLTDD